MTKNIGFFFSVIASVFLSSACKQANMGSTAKDIGSDASADAAVKEETVPMLYKAEREKAVAPGFLGSLLQKTVSCYYSVEVPKSRIENFNEDKAIGHLVRTGTRLNPKIVTAYSIQKKLEKKLEEKNPALSQKAELKRLEALNAALSFVVSKPKYLILEDELAIKFLKETLAEENPLEVEIANAPFIASDESDRLVGLDVCNYPSGQ